MRRKIFIGLTAILFMWIGYRGYRISVTRSSSPADTINFSYKDLDMIVKYSRPYKNGRVIFGEARDRSWLPNGKFWTTGFRVLTELPRTTGALVPNGKYWRLGANDATEITFNKNVIFASMPVNAGTYRMYAVPDQNTWQVCLNSEIGKFGYFEPDYNLDVVKVNISAESTTTETEQFTITFDNDSAGVKMNFAWDKTRVLV